MVGGGAEIESENGGVSDGKVGPDGREERGAEEGAPGSRDEGEGRVVGSGNPRDAPHRDVVREVGDEAPGGGRSGGDIRGVRHAHPADGSSPRSGTRGTDRNLTRAVLGVGEDDDDGGLGYGVRDARIVTLRGTSHPGNAYSNFHLVLGETTASKMWPPPLSTNGRRTSGVC